MSKTKNNNGPNIGCPRHVADYAFPGEQGTLFQTLTDKGWLKAPRVHLEDGREITLAKQSCFIKVFDRTVTPDMLATIKKVIDELLANRLIVYTASIAAGIDPK
eukprot:CAMPEP_0174929320 /NCGR_PEP_ID=MMETSP1355-20121228/27141_1 /TAXON_ID=464990 /ORGANISM="Hemiselmis tepida, Strain CCMP443" /LENGTH=103 /DNA_ID=CAMNT_0016175515 /DNA_START=51 /DNA_END=359 /DNA_ORIENTATION=-